VSAAASDEAEALYSLGNRLWREGARQAALAAFEEAVALAPGDAEARNNFGNALLETGQADAAIPQLEAVIALRPDHAAAHYNLGNALLAAGRAEDAAASFRAALRCNPEHAGAHNNLGNALRALGQPAEAAASYREAVRRLPREAGAHNNLAAALLALHRPAEAVAALRAALRCDPDHADACNNLGGALLALDRPEEALTWFRRASALDAAQVQARFGESLALLTLGRFREGWEAYESRWLDPQFCRDERTYDAPLWQGEDVTGRTLLLHAEQGLGDTIQFARYAPLLRRRGARVVLEVQAPLVTLLRNLGEDVVAAGDDLPPHDARCPLLSLPRLFRTELPTVPAETPYLHADPALRARWRAVLGPRTLPRVGLALSGSAEHPEDALRSIPAETLRPLLALPCIEWHLVQKELRDADAAVLHAHPNLRNHARRLGDFADTAALLAELDLLVSVDTSVAHLAGALALPVWLLVQSNPDFRWLRMRADSPWYPTMRLFRQTEMLRWAVTVARVAQALRARYDAS